MLVLSRKANETVVIDGGIKITVVAIRGDKVRLGFDAPRTTGIWRGELDISQSGAPRRRMSGGQKDRLIGAISKRSTDLSSDIEAGKIKRADQKMEHSEALYVARGVIDQFLDRSG